MRILFDTNVILDVLLDRVPFSDVAMELLEAVENGLIAGYVCATTITTIHYLASKAISPERAQAEIEKLLSLFEVAPVNRAVIEMALRNDVGDFEDAILCESAYHVQANGVVTRNTRDFRQANVTVYSPEELLGVLQLQNEHGENGCENGDRS